MTRALRRTLIGIAAVGLVAAWLFLVLPGAGWQGVDEAVVERVARLAGRAPRAVLFDADRGDLLLFLFLIAGGAGGFVGGYHFRGLFPPEHNPESR
jgi:hypothetical protein